MDDSFKNCKAVSELGIKTFMAMNCFNLDLHDENITNIYRLDELYEKVMELSRIDISGNHLEER